MIPAEIELCLNGILKQNWYNGRSVAGQRWGVHGGTLDFE